MIWNGNRNLPIKNLEENDEIIFNKKVAVFSPGYYNLNSVKLKKAEGKAINLSFKEKCLIRIK